MVRFDKSNLSNAFIVYFLVVNLFIIILVRVKRINEMYLSLIHTCIYLHTYVYIDICIFVLV